MHPGESTIIIVSGVPDRFSPGSDSFISPNMEGNPVIPSNAIINKDPFFLGTNSHLAVYQSNPDGNFVIYFELRDIEVTVSSNLVPRFNERITGGDVGIPSLGFASVNVFVDPKPIPLNSPIDDAIHGGSIQGYGVPDQLQGTQTYTIDPELINDVKFLASQTHHGEQHVDRWNRVLAGFGLIQHDNPMTAVEAEANSKKYSSPLWPKIAKVLKTLET